MRAFYCCTVGIQNYIYIYILYLDVVVRLIYCDDPVVTLILSDFIMVSTFLKNGKTESGELRSESGVLLMTILECDVITKG